MEQLHLLAQNLRNSSHVHSTFDISAELKNTNLVKLNDFFKAYAQIDVNKGRFGLYTEVVALCSKMSSPKRRKYSGTDL